MAFHFHVNIETVLHGEGDRPLLPASQLIYMLSNGGHIDMGPRLCQLCGSLSLRPLKPIESYSYLAD